MEVLAGKTSSLMAVSGRFGAMMSGAGEQVVHTLTQFGERIGIAFQLADDVLDIASDHHESGKTPGTDLREGVPTLPVLHVRKMCARAEADGERVPADDRRLVELLDGDLTDDALHAEALGLLRAHRALDLARQDSRRYAAEARAALAPLVECPAKQALAGLCDAAVDRAS
jgi:heptaprenyl diphosphate synthase